MTRKRTVRRVYALVVGQAWAADTRRQIEAMGKWPKNLQKYVDDHVNI